MQVHRIIYVTMFMQIIINNISNSNNNNSFYDQQLHCVFALSLHWKLIIPSCELLRPGPIAIDHQRSVLHAQHVNLLMFFKHLGLPDLHVTSVFTNSPSMFDKEQLLDDLRDFSPISILFSKVNLLFYFVTIFKELAFVIVCPLNI